MKKPIRNMTSVFAAVALCLAVVTACSRDSLDSAASGDGIVEKEVGISMAVRPQTRTGLPGYDTSENLHKIRWNAGDKMWCYSESGIYMDYTLKAADILTGDYEGQYARTHIVFRYGDEWVVSYFKGSAIGDYIGARKKDLLVLENGIPREQSGKFADCHICIVRSHPDADELVFENAQAFVRFEITDAGGAGHRDGKIFDHYVTKVTVQSLSGEMMAGNLEIKEINGWRPTLQNSGDEADRTITVIPEGGHFIPSPGDDDLRNYFVAVPARYYTEGIRFNLYTNDGVSEQARGYVDVPGISISSNQILNCHDLLKYCAFYVDGISLKYGDVTGVESITMAAGHAGKLVAEIHPDTATDQSLQWSVDDPTVCTVAQDGTVTALKVGSCTVTCTAKDGSGVTQSVVVSVTPGAGMGGGEYGHEDYEW